jgi:hypothetical protein
VTPKRLSVAIARRLGWAQGVLAGTLDRLKPAPAREPRHSIAMESMLLPNGRFLLVLSDVMDHEGTTPEHLDSLREKTGAAAVLVFSEPVVTYSSEPRWTQDVNPPDV